MSSHPLRFVLVPQSRRHSTALKVFTCFTVSNQPGIRFQTRKTHQEIIIFRFQPFNFGGVDFFTRKYRGTTFHHLSAAWRLASSSWMGEGGGCSTEKPWVFVKHFWWKGSRNNVTYLQTLYSNGGTFMNYTQECKDAMILACEKRVYSFLWVTRLQLAQAWLTLVLFALLLIYRFWMILVSILSLSGLILPIFSSNISC